MVKSLPNRIAHHVPSSPKKLAWHIKQASRTTLVAALAVPSLSLAQEPIRLEEIIVTATKRATDLQKVPSSITALNQSTLDDLNINNFQDYVKQLPSVSYTQRRPGQANLFMRGISEGGNSNQSLQGPSVAVYLNEQPVTAIGFNLDMHVYDVERIEVLIRFLRHTGFAFSSHCRLQLTYFEERSRCIRVLQRNNSDVLA